MIQPQNKKTEIKPAYCTFEQAKALKEKGFDSPSCLVKIAGDDNFYTQSDYNDFPKQREKELQYPEHWMILKWFKSEFNIDVTHTWNAREGRGVEGYSFEILYPRKDFVKGKSHYWEEFGLYLDYAAHRTATYRFGSSEEAISAAIDYVLNNLI